jgi:2-phosphoglycerate kinase
VSRIYLLGGPSNAGKSCCADDLASRHRLRSVPFDPYRVAVENSSSLGDPINFFRRGCDWLERDVEWVLARKNEVARLACDAKLDACLSEIERAGQDAIVEGDDLLPEVAQPLLESGRVASAAFLIEQDLSAVEALYRVRDGTDCLHGDAERMRRFLPHYARWADWLDGEARTRGYPVVDAAPMTGRCDRVAAALGL